MHVAHKYVYIYVPDSMTTLASDPTHTLHIHVANKALHSLMFCYMCYMIARRPVKG